MYHFSQFTTVVLIHIEPFFAIKNKLLFILYPLKSVGFLLLFSEKPELVYNTFGTPSVVDKSQNYTCWWLWVVTWLFQNVNAHIASISILFYNYCSPKILNALSQLLMYCLNCVDKYCLFFFMSQQLDVIRTPLYKFSFCCLLHSHWYWILY